MSAVPATAAIGLRRCQLLPRHRHLLGANQAGAGFFGQCMEFSCRERRRLPPCGIVIPLLTLIVIASIRHEDEPCTSVRRCLSANGEIFCPAFGLSGHQLLFGLIGWTVMPSASVIFGRWCHGPMKSPGRLSAPSAPVVALFVLSATFMINPRLVGIGVRGRRFSLAYAALYLALIGVQSPYDSVGCSLKLTRKLASPIICRCGLIAQRCRGEGLATGAGRLDSPAL